MVLKAEIQNLVERVTSGDARALARAITLVENRASESSGTVEGIVPAHWTGKSCWLDRVAEAPGKSTLVDHLAREYRKQQKTVGIIAVGSDQPVFGWRNSR